MAIKQRNKKLIKSLEVGDKVIVLKNGKEREGEVLEKPKLGVNDQVLLSLGKYREYFWPEDIIAKVE